jgi:thioredoxin-dependent peroxiredoxin
VLRQFDVRYFGISVDSPQTNARFARSLNLDYPILSDPSKEVARAYGVLSASGYASRWTFYIGADGRLLGVDRQVRAGSHGGDIASKLSELTVPKAS